MENYCDIVPHATGWVYVIDGVQSASYYHTYDLALDAARAHIARNRLSSEKIFRRQGLNGEMLPVSILRAGGAPGVSKASFRA